jgi:hypothetical protein
MDTKLNFITKCTRELLSNGFSVLIHRKKELDGYGGWFGAEDGEKELVVALDHDMGFEVFLHEYCHYLQWKNNRDLWDRSLLTYDTLFEWIDKPESSYTEEELNQSLHDILELEHDCENKALRLLQNNPIEGVSIDKYIRAVNAYLLHYHINRSLRKRPKNPIYSERVLSHMSNRFNPNLDYYLDSGNIIEPMRLSLLQEYEETQDPA